VPEHNAVTRAAGLVTASLVWLPGDPAVECPGSSRPRNEPPDMVINSLRSLLRIDYPRSEIVLIDDNTGLAGPSRPAASAGAGLLL
jgi:hypothetical protein